MGWIGILVGSWLGGIRGGLLGSLVGAYVGYRLEMWWRRRRARRASGASAQPPDGELERAYRTLGAKAGDGMDELKRKYRDLAKLNHPDALRAQGASEAQIAAATARMSRINAAWKTISKHNGLRPVSRFGPR